MPVIGIPLRGDDADVPLDLQDAFNHVYERGGYDLDLNYQNDPVPALRGELGEWAREVIRGNAPS